MQGQLRIYRIKDGVMDEWRGFFAEKIVPAHAAVGIEIVGAWVNPDDSAEFVWIRRFRDDAPPKEQEAEYAESPGRTALGNFGARYVDSVDVRMIESI